jgi:hypothetical protein
MTLAMVTLGGLGMVLGWWADLGFGPAAPVMRPAAVVVEAAPVAPGTDSPEQTASVPPGLEAEHMASSGSGPDRATSAGSTSEHAMHAGGHGHRHSVLSWMNLGMLLLGVPAMFLVRHTFEPFDFGRWCCGGMIVIGIPGMVIGMMAAMVLVQPLVAPLAPAVRVVLDYLAMMVGMVAGMLVPHALEYALPRTIRTAPVES